MATRADLDISKLQIQYRTVETGQTCVLYDCVKDGNSDKECQPIAAETDLMIGIVVELGKLEGAAGDKVGVALLSGAGLVKVRAGGTCTRGQQAKYGGSAGTLADAVPNGAPTTGDWVQTAGYFTQSGVSGDLVGMVPVRGGVLEE